MNDITVITAPDILYNNTFSILLICPNNQIKQIIHDIMLNSEVAVNIYLYEDYEETDIEWLLNVAKIVDITILDLDNVNHDTRIFASYLLGSNKTFYLTSDNTVPYNLINKNRIYDLQWLEQVVYNKRGNDE